MPSRWTFFEIPFQDSDGNGENDLAGTNIQVDYTPVSPTPHTDCTTGTQSETHTIGTGGSATEGGVVSFTGSNTAASLVDRPASETVRCRYVANYQDSFSLGSAEYELATADDNIEITGASHPDPTYVLTNSFDSDITINVPDYQDDSDSSLNYFNGADFMVNFTPPATPANCTSAFSHRYVVSSSRTAAPEGAAPKLIDMPSGESTSCVYTVAFPASESPDTSGGAAPAWTLNRQEAATATLQRNGAITRNYLASAITFTPTAALAVPGIVHLSNPSTNLFAGLEFELAFGDGTGATDVGGANACSTGITSITYTVQPGSSVTRAAGVDLPTLIDRPAGLDNRCSYAITTPAEKTSANDAASVSDAALTWTLTRQTGHTESINRLNPAITVAYDTSNADVTFLPEVAIMVPQYRQDAPAGGGGPGSGGATPPNWFTGETFDVEFDKSSGPASGCTADNTEFTYTIQDDGTVTTADDTTLVGYPSSQTAACVYAVTYPVNEEGGTRLDRIATGLDAATQANDRATGATYHGETSFDPTANITVPFIDRDTNMQNDLAGETITVTFVPAPGSDEGCSGAGQGGQEADPTETYTVQTGGTFAAGGQISGPGTAVSLVDRPSGVLARCSYLADFSNSIDVQSLGVFELIEGDNSPLSATSATVAAAYNGNTFFEITLTVDVPQYDRDGAIGTNYYEGAEFDIEYAPAAGADSGCSSADSKTHVMQDTGMAAPFDGSFKLIDIPEGTLARCSYTLTFPDSVPSDPNAPATDPVWELLRQGGDSAATAEVSYTSSTALVEYLAGVINFAPKISPTVPSVAGVPQSDGGEPANVFIGTSFTVTLVQRTGGGLPTTGCSLESEIQLVFTVAADGEVTSGDVPEQLVDRPAESDVRCEYDVGFPASVSSLAGAELSWTLSRPSNAGTLVSGGAQTAASAYSVGEINFVPDVAISVPPYNHDDDPDTEVDESRSNAFAGLRFQVEFAHTGLPAGCSPKTLGYTVQPGGSVTPDGGPASLVDRPVGASARCTYAVTFPDSESAGTQLQLQSGSSTSVDATAQAVSAAYLTRSDSTFAPDVVITVDMLDTDRNTEHDLSGALIQVGFARVSGASTSCTESASETYAVADDGTVSLAQPPLVEQAQLPAQLVDRPAGSNVRCRYVVSYPTALSHPDEPEQERLVLPRDVLAAAAEAAGPAGIEGDTVTANIDGGTRLTLVYIDPPKPRIIPAPVPLMSVNTGVPRVPVRVAVEVPAGDFAVGSTFEVLVSVPGACGSDTFLFGGVPASVGLTYAADATIRGEALLLGEGALFDNSRASYSLPPTSGASAAGASASEPCSIRVTALSSPSCTLSSPDGTDSRGRNYIQVTWSSGATAFDLTARYTCLIADRTKPETQDQITLTRGWVTLPFNGATGTTPVELLNLLGGAVSSMWVWDAAGQSWRGWSALHGSLGLTQLTQGDTIMAYAHIDVTVTYSPADLLVPPESTGRQTLAPRFNLISYGGDSPADIAGLLPQPSPAAVMFLWHVPSQNWRYHLPGRQPIAGFEIPWFDTLNPGDTVFIYNASPSPASIPWA